MHFSRSLSVKADSDFDDRPGSPAINLLCSYFHVPFQFTIPLPCSEFIMPSHLYSDPTKPQACRGCCSSTVLYFTISRPKQCGLLIFGLSKQGQEYLYPTLSPTTIAQSIYSPLRRRRYTKLRYTVGTQQSAPPKNGSCYHPQCYVIHQTCTTDYSGNLQLAGCAPFH
jgi:hypothetical protein